MKRIVPALCLASALAALAQPPVPTPASSPQPAAACADCGIVRSIRRVEKPVLESPRGTGKPSGLVASVPLDGGKATVGSSLDKARADQPPVVTWEVIVLMDDGKFRMAVHSELPDLKVGDLVRVEKGRAQRR